MRQSGDSKQINKQWRWLQGKRQREVKDKRQY